MRARADAAARSAGARTRSADEAVASSSATRKKTLFLAIFASSSATREGIWHLAILAPAQKGSEEELGTQPLQRAKSWCFRQKRKKGRKGIQKIFRKFRKFLVVNIKSGTFQVVSKRKEHTTRPVLPPVLINGRSQFLYQFTVYKRYSSNY